MLVYKLILKQFITFLFAKMVKCSIDGLRYLDPIKRRPIPSPLPQGNDPCNPLYWYPRDIPEFCNHRRIHIPEKIPPALSIPIPGLAAPFPVLSPFPYEVPIIANNPLSPIGPAVPIYPYNPNLYGPNPQLTGMVPGLPGLVTKGGGINILPFSDVYTDLIENHRNEMIRKRLEKLIDDYENSSDD